MELFSLFFSLGALAIIYSMTGAIPTMAIVGFGVLWISAVIYLNNKIVD